VTSVKEINFENGKSFLPKESVPGDRHTADHGEKTIDVYKLIHLSESLPIKSVSLEELHDTKFSDADWIDKNGKRFGPRQIIEAVEKYKGDPDWDEVSREHPEWADDIEEIRNADYINHPIILIGSAVIDGMHRVTKAWVQGAKNVNARRFMELPEDSVTSESADA